jgi:hypothetical protein
VLAVLAARAVAGQQPVRVELVVPPLFTIEERADGSDRVGPDVSVTLFADTALVVDDDPPSLRWISRQGALRRTGRWGRAHGEFVGIRMLGLVGDSAVLWDPALRRLTVVAPDGRALRSIRQASLGDPPAEPVLALPDGRLLLKSVTAIAWRGQAPEARDTAQLFLASINAPDERVFTGRWPDRRYVRAAADGRLLVAPDPLSPQLFTLRAGPRTLLIDGHSGVIQVMHAPGAPSRRQLPLAPRAVTDAEYAAAAADALANVPESPGDGLRRGYAQAFRQASGRVAPAIVHAIGSPTGALWVRPFGAGHYLEVDADGNVVGRLALPSADVLLAADSTTVAIRRADPDGRMRVHVHRLRRAVTTRP